MREIQNPSFHPKQASDGQRCSGKWPAPTAHPFLMFPQSALQLCTTRPPRAVRATHTQRADFKCGPQSPASQVLGDTPTTTAHHASSVKLSCSMTAAARTPVLRTPAFSLPHPAFQHCFSKPSGPPCHLQTKGLPKAQS